MRDGTSTSGSAVSLVLAVGLLWAPIGLADGGVLDGGDLDGGPALADGGPSGDAGVDPTDGGAMTGDEDAGTVEPGSCTPACDGNVLRFCDAVTEMPLSIDCDELQGRCGILDNSWGLDCLLPEGATCTPGYAEGRSRCDAVAGLVCHEGTCQMSDDPMNPRPEVPSNAGGIGDASTVQEHPLSCLGCTNDANGGGFPFGLASLFTALGLRTLRRRDRVAGRPDLRSPPRAGAGAEGRLS